MDKVTRVRYKKEENKYVSTKQFLGNEGVLLRVEIDVPSLTVSVMERDRVVVSKTCESVLKCKLSVKDMLKEYGVTFFDETRGTKIVLS